MYCDLWRKSAVAFKYAATVFTYSRVHQNCILKHWFHHRKIRFRLKQKDLNNLQYSNILCTILYSHQIHNNLHHHNHTLDCLANHDRSHLQFRLIPNHPVNNLYDNDKELFIGMYNLTMKRKHLCIVTLGIDELGIFFQHLVFDNNKICNYILLLVVLHHDTHNLNIGQFWHKLHNSHLHHKHNRHYWLHHCKSHFQPALHDHNLKVGAKYIVYSHEQKHLSLLVLVQQQQTQDNIFKKVDPRPSFLMHTQRSRIQKLSLF